MAFTHVHYETVIQSITVLYLIWQGNEFHLFIIHVDNTTSASTIELFTIKIT